MVSKLTHDSHDKEMSDKKTLSLFYILQRSDLYNACRSILCKFRHVSFQTCFLSLPVYILIEVGVICINKDEKEIQIIFWTIFSTLGVRKYKKPSKY